MKGLTQRGVLAQFQVEALEALLGPPAVVSSLHDDVDLLVAVLAHVPAEYPTPAAAADGVSAVHGAPPHVSDPVRVHLRPGVRVVHERVVGGDRVRHPAGRGASVHMDSEHFSQQSAPAWRKDTKQDTATVSGNTLKGLWLWPQWPGFEPAASGTGHRRADPEAKTPES